MQHRMILPVILSGGVGSRLWPLSRAAHPKPFIKLDDGQSFIQKTYLRAIDLETVEEVITVTNRDLFFYTRDEFDEVAKKQTHNTFLLEPFGRNSTAAIAVAAHYASSKYGAECVLLILPADHLIGDTEAFAKAVSEASELASSGKLVTFGIKPDAPKTGFGYIEASGNKVVRFVEKPDLQTAEEYLVSGGFFWNSGMFCMTAAAFCTELEKLCPDIAEQSSTCFSNAKYSQGTGWHQYEINHDDFEPIRDISVDYAVFEKSRNVAIVPCDIAWSDIGSWTELGTLHPLDAAKNHVAGDVILEDVQGCIVHGNNKLIAALGIKNIVIADTADALLIARKDRSQDVGQIVSKLKQSDHPSFREFPTVHRPWGTYTVLLEGTGFKLKRIEVKPGASLSLQSHQCRSEHWVVVSGVATVINGDKLIELERNLSTYIPAGNKHRLENHGDELLTLIEVQCGDYLGEDDIIRYDDKYGRST